MVQAKQVERKANLHRFLKLNNSNTALFNRPTFPVSVDESFLSSLLDLEKSYDTDNVIMFRRNSHPIRKFHITSMSIRLMMTISRRFNNEGTLVGCPIHRLFTLMNNEYEEPASKEQFYAEVHKFIELGLLSVSKSGIIDEMKVEVFKRKSNRFVLFNPLIFSQAFTSLPLPAQKLYLYLVHRNGSKVNTEFKEYLGKGSWIYKLTHKSRPAQVRELLQSLAALEPVTGEKLLLSFAVDKDLTGRWSLRCILNLAYIVQHVEGTRYREVPKAKIPYTKTVNQLRMLLNYHRLNGFESLDNGQMFLRLAQLLHHAGMKKLRYSVQRIREMYERRGFDWGNLDVVDVLKTELEDESYISFMEVAHDTGIDCYLGMGDEGALDDVRPFQFVRAVSSVFSLTEFKRICKMALPILKERFGTRLTTTRIVQHYNRIRTSKPESSYFYLEDFLKELAQLDTVLYA